MERAWTITIDPDLLNRNSEKQRVGGAANGVKEIDASRFRRSATDGRLRERTPWAEEAD